MQTGAKNLLTDVNGIAVGHFTDTAAASGVTVVLCPDNAVAGVDVRGAAPGTRETDLLSPVNLVSEVQAVVLSGGSVFGLAAADGVVRWLAEHGRGFPLDDTHVAPIVPAAVLFDLGRGTEFVPPIDASWGRRACDAATGGVFETGTVGAGTGAFSWSIKGGLGSASQVLASGHTVAALVAVNSDGAVVNPSTGRFWEAGLQIGDEFGGAGTAAVRLPQRPDSAPVKNTTIGVVATDAELTKAQAQKIAQMAHDGMARAIRPAHTMFDGDTIFCLATGKKPLSEAAGFFPVARAQSINALGHAAADCMARAIIRGIADARTLGGMTAHRDLPRME